MCAHWPRCPSYLRNWPRKMGSDTIGFCTHFSRTEGLLGQCARTVKTSHPLYPQPLASCDRLVTVPWAGPTSLISTDNKSLVTTMISFFFCLHCNIIISVSCEPQFQFPTSVSVSSTQLASKSTVYKTGQLCTGRLCTGHWNWGRKLKLKQRL